MASQTSAIQHYKATLVVFQIDFKPEYLCHDVKMTVGLLTCESAITNFMPIKVGGLGYK